MLTSTTVHWHGLYQSGSNWADGTAMVTQCPINPGNSFLYNFDVPDQAGTYWYHSHIGNQYCDGLRGPFVVYDPSDPFSDMYDVDDESTIVTLADWYHVVSTSSEAASFPTSNSVLINGKGRWHGPSGATNSSLSVISVQQGKRIDGHNMMIIEVDGVNHQPLTVDSIQILAGQRYSFILEADQQVQNYWIRSLPNSGDGTNYDSDGVNAAILRYIGAPSTEPTTTLTQSIIPLQETNLHPLSDPAAPGGKCEGCVDYALNLEVDFVRPIYSGLLMQIAGNFIRMGVTYNTPYVNPPVPVLLQILSGAQNPSDLMPAGNKVVEISFPMGADMNAGAPHPVHLHGHTFSVVRSAGSTVYNYDNPVRRDVVSLGGNDPINTDNATIRFATDNAGPWFLHCHIDWHLSDGFGVVMAEDIPDVQKTEENLPVAWDKLCPTSVNNGTAPLATNKMRRVYNVARQLHHGSHSF
ncbi:multicopper oxidase [Neolentinus lepideus HHB14362 ss-1]|uniref:Multicopper oxidase n=1 Tax=Neolentinus lepideus HHB14362 ss-1 TaxID=1314782 RepID=A0A165N1B6_9AGAM|nr:multicopper oxidase [Neolentinus lepideus HHB14362 ss-1]